MHLSKDHRFLGMAIRRPPQIARAGGSRIRPVGDRVIHFLEGPIAFIALKDQPPFFARAWLGWVASEKLIGSAELTALTRDLSRRFTMEELADELAHALWTATDGSGAAVRLRSLHLGRSLPSGAESIAWSGVYLESSALKSEFIERTRKP